MVNEQVLAYKKRRNARLKQRAYRKDDNEVAEWITTENGVHVPLDKDKVAVGGALEGKEFNGAGEKAKVVKARRKQKDIPNEKEVLGPNGRVLPNHIDEFNENAFKSILEETGYSEEEAKKFHDNIRDFFGGDFGAFAAGLKEEEEKIIDDGLARMGAYDGEIYRGMNFDDYSNDSLSKFKNCQVGDEIEMRTISSWSSDRSVAEGFGGFNSLTGSGVVLVCKNNKSAVGVQHISKFAKREAEVLAPSTSRWRVTKKKTISKYKFLKDYYTAHSPSLADRVRLVGIIEGMKGALSKRSIVTLEVEEI